MKKRGLSVLLLFCMLLTMVPPALATGAVGSTVPTVPTEERIIYVSEKGDDEEGDGSIDNPYKTLEEATKNAKAGDIYQLSGTVKVELGWITPDVPITIRGDGPEVSRFEMAKGGKVNYGSGNKASLYLGADVTFDNLTIATTKSSSIFDFAGFSIIANGNKLVFTESATTPDPNKETYTGFIFGGGYHEDIQKDTCIENYGKLYTTTIYGGGCGASVTGDVTLKHEGFAMKIFGGGYAAYGSQKPADVTGNIHVIVGTTEKAANLSSGALYCGGDASNNDAKVNGSTELTTNSFQITAGGVAFYGGGVASSKGCADVSGDVKITVNKTDMSGNSGTLYAGGRSTDNNKTANIDGKVEMNISGGNFGAIYGGGEGKSAIITETVAIHMTDCAGTPSVHAGGKSSAQNKGAVTIDVTNSKPDIYALGNEGSVEGRVTIKLHDGGASRDISSVSSTIYNCDESEVKNVSGSGRLPTEGTKYKEGTEIIVDGKYTATRIFGVPVINIKANGALLEHTKEFKGSTKYDAKLFNDCTNVAVEKGGTLDLLQTNEISGTFNCAGTLTMPQSAELIAGGKVTVSDGAMFVPTDGYKMGDVFLKSKTAFTQDTQPEFAVNRKGETDGYFTANRAISDGQSEVKNEWYVSQLFTLKPLELTKYIAGGEHNHDDPAASNCFPDPRFVGLDEDAEIKVNGNVWNKSEHHGQYPFVINYYDKDGTLLEDDHKPGTYVAKVEPSDGIKLTNITINGCKIKTEDSLLHIRNVSDVAGIENIDQFASAIQSGEPTGAVKDATAVIPDSTNYLVNNLAGQIPNADADIRLLHDELLSAAAGEDPFMKVLQQRLEGTLEGATTSDVKVEADPNRQYAMKYLDLIDANDSNLLVCAQGAYDIYLPYPAGTDQNTEFALYRFDDLNRTYTQADSGEGALDNIKKTSIRKVEVTNEKAGIKFTVPADFASEKNYSIGAMALTWVKESSGGGVTTRYTLSYDSNGGTQYKDERYVRNTVVQLDKVPTREGYTFTGWYADKELTQAITEIKMTSNKTVYAGWEETDVPGMLNGEDHYAYVVGYEDGTVRPGGNISRAEVATIFFRLLQDQVRQENLTTENVFSDVSAGDWYNTAISTMAELGILKGRTPDTFVPNAPITRAEFAAICARFDTGENAGGATFPDLAGHWAKEEVERAVSLGWIMGYEDNTFRPDKAITRAEAVTMINRVLQRNPQSPEDLLKDMVTWPDNQDPSQWYYLAIQEATNSHDYERTTGIYETWTQLRETPDWSQYE